MAPLLTKVDLRGTRRSNGRKIFKAPLLENSARVRSCVIVVENLAVPIDRRVWQEARALVGAGWSVSVICPRSESYPASFEMRDGIAIYRHSLPLEAEGRFAFLVEYAFALFHQFRLLCKVHREQGFSIIQACNPPDLIFLVALPFKLIGKRFVFDQHDVSPELFIAKFQCKGLFYHLLLTSEWLTYKCADFVISANASFRELAIGRGAMRPEEVETVYSIPDRINLYRTSSHHGIRNGKRLVLGYLGIIGTQDGVDHMIRVVAHLVRDEGFEDFQAVIVGNGPALTSVRALAAELGVAERITFTGYLTGDILMSHVSAFDIGLIPDPINACNDIMSMNKVFEYSALGIPTVAYPLKETRRLLGDVAIYADAQDPADLAKACLRLMLDDSLRKQCSDRTSALALSAFSWPREARKYVDAFERVLRM